MNQGASPPLQGAFPPHDAPLHDALSHDAFSSSSTSTRNRTKHSSSTSKINEQKNYNFLDDQDEEMEQCQKSSTFSDSNRLIERNIIISSSSNILNASLTMRASLTVRASLTLRAKLTLRAISTMRATGDKGEKMARNKKRTTLKATLDTNRNKRIVESRGSIEQAINVLRLLLPSGEKDLAIG